MRRIADNVMETSACPCQDRQCIFRDALLSLGGAGDGVQVCRIPGMIKKRVYQPKEVLFHESSPAANLFFLRSGFVKLTTELPDGRSQVLRLGASGQFLGLEALTDPLYPYRAEAAGEVNVCTILYKDLLRILAQNPSMALLLIKALNRELQRSNDMIRNLGLMSSTEKIASFLLSMAPDQSTSEMELPMPLSRKEMAEMLGLTLETVSRVIAKLMRDGVIYAPRCAGHFRILDRERLSMASGTRVGPIAVKTERRIPAAAIYHLR